MDPTGVLAARLAEIDPSAAVLVVELEPPGLTVLVCEEPNERVAEWVGWLAKRGPVTVAYSRASPAQLRALAAAGAVECLPLGFSVRGVVGRLLPAGSLVGLPGAGGVRLTECGLEAAGTEFRLSPTEYRLVQVLWAAEGRTVSHAELEWALYGRTGPSERLAVRQVVYRLRARLGALGRMVEAVPGFGYRLRRQGPAGDKLLSGRYGRVIAS